MSLSAIAVELLLPPTSLALLAFLALVVGWRWVAAILLAPLVALSLPVVGTSLLASLDPGPAPDGPPPAAIVILSADVDRTATDGVTALGALTLERERAGAALYRSTGLPVLVTGGIVTAPPPVGILMAQSMPADFNVPVRWTEAASATTWDNAQLSAPILHAAGIQRVYLVTHAWHMRRSLLAFRRAGLDPVPVVVHTDPWPRRSPLELMPRASAWMRSYYAIHEWVGLLYYGLRR